MSVSGFELSIDETAANLSQNALEAALADLSLSEHVIVPGCTQGAEQADDVIVDQLEPSQPSYSNNNNSAGVPELLQSHTPSVLTVTDLEHGQTLSDNVTSTRDPVSSLSQSSSIAASRTASLSQHPLDSATLSGLGVTQPQQPFTAAAAQAATSSAASSSASLSSGADDLLLMLKTTGNTTDQSRPITALHCRPETEGASSSSSDNSTGSSSTANQAPISASLRTDQNVHVTARPASEPQAAVAELESTFDQSIKFAHAAQRDTVGDTTIHSSCLPLTSSTPHVPRTSADQLGRYLQEAAADTAASESDSDTNISKFMRRAGVPDYVDAETRDKLLIGFQTPTQFDKPNRDSVDYFMNMESRDVAGGDDDSTMRQSSKSMNWHELIPDRTSIQSSKDFTDVNDKNDAVTVGCV